MKVLFTKNQNEFFKKQIELNKEVVQIWNITNAVIPILIILIPTMMFSFLPDGKNNFQNLILNGSFSLLGINILFSMSIFLVNSFSNKDIKMERQIVELRIRLIIYLCVSLIFGAMFYVIQIVYEINSSQKLYTVLIALVLILYVSLGIGKRIYLVKDELVGKSINQDIKDTVEELKNATNDLQ